MDEVHEESESVAAVPAEDEYDMATGAGDAFIGSIVILFAVLVCTAIATFGVGVGILINGWIGLTIVVLAVVGWLAVRRWINNMVPEGY